MSILVKVASGFAMAAHIGQKRKYTGEPYYNHCVDVMQTIRDESASYRGDEAVLAAALLHDTIEDTPITHADIAQCFGEPVADLVLEVTNVSKPEDGSRAIRKKIDMNHLAQSSPAGATIKLADIISNVMDIAENDFEFARVYVPEKEALLPLLKHGDKRLYYLAGHTIACAQVGLRNYA